MNHFYQNSYDGETTLVVEDDGKVAYAYLLRHGTFIAHVWLYNHHTPDNYVDFSKLKKENAPFLNPKPYINNQIHDQITKQDFFKYLHIEWIPAQKTLLAKVFYGSLLVAIITPGAQPGWSSCAAQNGRLAKIMVSQAEILRDSSSYYPSESK